MHTLTIQIHDGEWQDAMTITFHEPQKGFLSPCSFGYLSRYLANHIEDIPGIFATAVSAQLPLEWNEWSSNEAPAFIHDIAPAGAARRFLLQRLGHDKPDDLSADLFLLARSTPAPIGNLRIRESVEALDKSRHMGFSREEIIQRDTGFLEYAYEQGAAIGGATGAGGEAPKLLMTQDEEGLLHPDAQLEDKHAVNHWFIKFPRNQSRDTDKDILRSEFHFYKALDALGVDTVATQAMRLEEAEKPSLWLERFDRRVADDRVERVAVESIYSLAGVTEPGSYMNHIEVIKLLHGLWSTAGQKQQVQELVQEYLRRDLLNKILGNSDNHGRNTAIIRDADGLRPAPLYDVAPMVMDEEGVTRTTKWPMEIERAGTPDWRSACHALKDLIDPEAAFDHLRDDAQRFLALPDLLLDSGLPSATFNHPAISLGDLGKRLKAWSLL